MRKQRQNDRATAFRYGLGGLGYRDKLALLAGMRGLLDAPATARLWRVVGATGAVTWLVTGGTA